MLKITEMMQQNSFYDGRFSNNGGGYYQPYYKINGFLSNGQYVTIEIDDSSIGDFGDRIYMAIATNEGKYYMYHYDNTMQFEVWRECDVPASLAKKNK